ncbi:MAG: toll/interleukin-1 receptor domain-containing protein [Actinophytocola sp.]|uniref:toll/interleukin-1 receptor domain-containing protein n=1 Tax=Actinophytocola sp. TaxID=1872138 RepID=UPI003C707403
MSADIFINYRGIDADYAPALLFERLSRRFGNRRLFLDDRTIAPGEDYVRRLLEGVRASKVLLAVIGPRWFARDDTGARLIDNPNDWIRRELATAFECGVIVIPVFTEGARPPRPTELPDDIEQLGRQNGLPLRRVRSGDDIESIVRRVSVYVPARRRRFLLIVVATAMLLLGVGVVLPSVLSQDQHPSAPGPGTTTSVTRTTTTTSQENRTTESSSTPPTNEPELWWEGTLTLDGNAFSTGYTLDTSPPSRQPAGDIGLVCQLGCAANEIGGTEFAAWTDAGFPAREQCANLLNSNPGQRLLSVKVGTKACFGTVEKRVGHLEVVEISGRGQMKIDVKVWNVPPR